MTINLPNALYHNYRKISKSNLVKEDNPTGDCYEYVEKLLNAASPDPSSSHYEREMTMKQFVRSLYELNPNKRYNGYINLVKGTYLECTILWTPPMSIMKHFNLFHKAYIKWNNETKTFSVTKYVSNKNSNICTPAVHPIVQNRHTNSTYTNVKKNKSNDEKPVVKNTDMHPDLMFTPDRIAEARRLRTNSWADLVAEEEATETADNEAVEVADNEAVETTEAAEVADNEATESVEATETAV